MELLIGASGLARAGKDTLAQALGKLGYTRLAFADALKEATALIANEPKELYFDEKAKDEFTEALSMTRRQALQGLGGAVRDTLGPMTWVNRALRQWVANGRPATVISDVRYPNEAEAIRGLGGVVVRVERTGAGLKGEAAKHASEAGIPDHLVDYIIDNNGTLDDLFKKAGALDAHVRGRA